MTEDGKIGRLAFYDRSGKVIIDFKGSYDLKSEIHTTIIEEN